jgi:hypothetical protein
MRDRGWGKLFPEGCQGPGADRAAIIGVPMQIVETVIKARTTSVKRRMIEKLVGLVRRELARQDHCRASA